MFKQLFVFACAGIASLCMTHAVAAVPDGEEGASSIHAGFLYPNGVDIVGYTTEKKLDDYNKIFRFYTFGLPSIAAAGLAYYENFVGNGFIFTAGVGVGSVFYSSAAYQLRLDKNQYLKFGAGLAAGVAYTGIYPALSYEYRLN